MSIRAYFIEGWKSKIGKGKTRVSYSVRLKPSFNLTHDEDITNFLNEKGSLASLSNDCVGRLELEPDVLTELIARLEEECVKCNGCNKHNHSDLKALIKQLKVDEKTALKQGYAFYECF